MSHVRVERLCSSDREDDRGQREESRREVSEQEAERVAGRQRLQDLGVVDDPAHTAGADRAAPDAHHRPEHTADGARAKTWTRNRQTMIATVIGTIRSLTEGAATLTPSIAESTEIAGVIMLSPKNSDAPKTPSAASTSFVRRPPGTPRRRIKVISAMT